MDLLSPNILFDNRYRLITLKGRGTFGEVWHAYDVQTEMDVAVKVYIALDDRGVAEFVSEYRNAFSLNHPNLLHAYQFNLFHNRPYLVMPYCPNSAVELVGRADEATLWRLVRDVASGLSYLHGKGIIHRDIKPDNILKDQDGDFVVTDFGISTKMRSTLQRNSLRNSGQVTKGSISYMAPEMFSAQADAVYASDIWALGATLYEIAFDELPLMGQGGGTLLNNAKVEFPKTTYSKELIDTIKECLAKEPWDRPRAEQLAERAKSELEGKTQENIYKSITQSGYKARNIATLAKLKNNAMWILVATVMSVILFIVSALMKKPFLHTLALSIGIADWIVLCYWLILLLVNDIVKFKKTPIWILVGFAIALVAYSIITSMSSDTSPIVNKTFIFIVFNCLSVLSCWIISLMAKGKFDYKKALLWMALASVPSLIMLMFAVYNIDSVKGLLEVLYTMLILTSVSVLVVNWIILHCMALYFIVSKLTGLERKTSQEREGVTKEKGFFSTIRKAKR